MMEQNLLNKKEENNIINKILYKIVLIPNILTENREKSTFEILHDIQYFDYYKNISVSDIERVLKNDSQIVRNWIQFSEDKRVTAGWYFKKNNDNCFIVGFHEKNKGFSNTKKFHDPMRACAYFIKKELESLSE